LWGRIQRSVRGYTREDLVLQSMNYHTGLLDLKMKPYGCYSTGFNTGILECVMNSKTLAGIQTEFAGKLSGAFSSSTMTQYIRYHNSSEEDYKQCADNFIQTCAGYCVCTYVLGIGDRHADNIMVQKSGHFFHIDFGHFLGHFKSKFGVNRERSPFVFTPEMAEVCREKFVRTKEESSSKTGAAATSDYLTPFTEFESLCIRAFNILRAHANLLLNLMVLMIPAMMPELTLRADIEYMKSHLHLDLTDVEAADRFMTEIAQCLATFSRQLDNFLHNVKHY
jgi:phosphatidylinositol-4,5-bisphosphate 3-kinase